MSQEIATLPPAEFGQPLTSKQVRSRLAVIQDVLQHVMQKEVDFGVIPGTDKPTLLKPGAEKICVTFRLSADTPDIESVPELSGDIRYRVRVPIRSADGTVVAVGVGECSTGEEKYRWRRPVHPKEYDAAPEDRRREKWTRKGDVWKQVRVEPADVANTVLKMAHKRAYVHGVIMATAAGSIFAQDLEDRPEGLEDEGDGRSRVSKPQERGQAPVDAEDGYISEPQVRRLIDRAKQLRISEADLRAHVGGRYPGTKDEHGKAHFTRIRRSFYDDVLDGLEGLSKPRDRQPGEEG